MDHLVEGAQGVRNPEQEGVSRHREQQKMEQEQEEQHQHSPRGAHLLFHALRAPLLALLRQPPQQPAGAAQGARRQGHHRCSSHTGAAATQVRTCSRRPACIGGPNLRKSRTCRLGRRRGRRSTSRRRLCTASAASTASTGSTTSTTIGVSSTSSTRSTTTSSTTSTTSGTH